MKSRMELADLAIQRQRDRKAKEKEERERAAAEATETAEDGGGRRVPLA